MSSFLKNTSAGGKLGSNTARGRQEEGRKGAKGKEGSDKEARKDGNEKRKERKEGGRK